MSMTSAKRKEVKRSLKFKETFDLQLHHSFGVLQTHEKQEKYKYGILISFHDEKFEIFLSPLLYFHHT